MLAATARAAGDAAGATAGSVPTRSASGIGQQASSAALTASTAIDGLLQSSPSNTDQTFWNSIWPQLEAAGWTANTAAGAAPQPIFYPPHAPSTSTGQPEGLPGIHAVMQHLQHNPQLLPAAAGAASAIDAAAAAPVGRGPRATTPGAAGPPGIKVCENCGTTTTPLWRKDKQTGMMMCNACGIFFKHHQKHRPVELSLLPPRSQQHGAIAGKAAAAPQVAGAADSEGEEEVVAATGGNGSGGGAAASWEPHRTRRRTAPPPSAASESDYSEQSDDDDPEEQRRSLRPRRARQQAEEYLHELRSTGAADGAGGIMLAAPAVVVASDPAAMAHGAASSGEDKPHAAYDSDGGSDMSSVQLVMDEAVAERQRVELINRLVKEAFPADYDGAIEGLKSLKQARITDPTTGQSFGLVRLYADPGAEAPEAAVHKPARHVVPPKPAKPAVQRAPAAAIGSKAVQVCYNCNTTSTPLWRKERETGRMYCNACGIFKKTHGIERPLGTSRFKQYSGPGPQARSRGKRSRGGGRAGGGGRRHAAKAGSPDLHASESEVEGDALPMSGSEDEAEEQHEHPAAAAFAAAEAAAAAAAGPAALAPPPAGPASEEAGGRRTTSGRAVRPPRSRLGEAAAVTSPELEAAAAAELADYDAVEAIRRRQQLPALPGNLSLFKPAPVVVSHQPQPQPSAVALVGTAAAAVPLQLPPASVAPAASTGSEASAYSQPQPAVGAPASMPAYGVPLLSVISNIEAGLAQLPTLAAGGAQWTSTATTPMQYANTLPGIPLR